MYLNNLTSARGSKNTPKRLGRGIGSGLGKTCGRGHKGQKSRAGGSIRRGFEGGQTPLYRRLPKFGFNSKKSQTTCEVRLSDLSRFEDDTIDINILKSANIVNSRIRTVKVILSGQLSKPIRLKGLAVTQNVRNAIESAGGKVEG
jgi:large subunit ribosomal protein L15